MLPFTTPPVLSAGTTQRIINLYAAYGIQTQKIAGQPGVAIGLRDGERYAYANLGTVSPALLGQLLPVLRPYAALCQPLPDNTIPAVTVARVLADDRDDDYRYELVSAADLPPVVNVSQRSLEGGWTLRHSLRILPNWNFAWQDARGQEDRMRNVLEAYDYLRANLFAAPVGGQKLVEGVDFIALERGALVEKIVA